MEKKQKSILVLSDNFEFRMALIRTLRLIAPTIHSTWSAAEAIRLTQSKRPDLVILDAAIDYREVSAEIKKLTNFLKAQNPRPKTIVLYTLSNEKEEAEKLKCDLTFQMISFNQHLKLVQELLNK